jgi:hypothetical protein
MAYLFLFPRRTQVHDAPKGWLWWLWESSVLIPLRMAKYRRKEAWIPPYTAQPLLYILPWMVAAVWWKPDILYWLPVLIFVIVTAAGRVVRPNHLLPLAGWIAMSGIHPAAVMALSAVDWASAGFYFGDIWFRFYPWLGDMNRVAEAAGKWLRDKKGSLWVNGLHTAVYIHARKPVPFGMAEQIEINGVAIERRKEMTRRFKQAPPDWVVDWDNTLVTFVKTGYQCVNPKDEIKVWKKAGATLRVSSLRGG